MIDCINFQREKYLRYKNSRLKYFLIHSKNEFHSDFHIFQRRASFRNSPRQIFLYLEIFVAKFFKFIFTLLRLASNVFNRLHYPEYLAQLSLDYVTRHSSSLIPSRRSRSNYSRPAGCRRVIQRERERERERKRERREVRVLQRTRYGDDFQSIFSGSKQKGITVKG